MNTVRRTPALIIVAAIVAACEAPKPPKPITQVASVDSVTLVRQQLLDEITASGAFLDDITEQLEKARALSITPTQPGDLRRVETEREEALAGVTRLVVRLDSVQTRLTSARNQIASMGKKETALLAQVAAYQKTIAEVQATAETQRVQLQTILDQQQGQIVALSGQVDTLEKTRLALSDTVNRLTVHKNTAYVVIGTREELIKKGVLVAEGQKRFLVAGSRTIVPARALDPANFTRIDRRTDRTIILPDGEYRIVSRQNPEFATVSSKKPGKISGVMTIEQPEQFWESSPFLIIVKS